MRVALMVVVALSMLASSAHAGVGCFCHDTDNDGYPEEDGTCTSDQGGAANQFTYSPLFPGEAPPHTTPDIVITLDAAYTCGQYMTGSVWVRENTPGGGVTISRHEPDFQQIAHGGEWGNKWGNGYEINPLRVNVANAATNTDVQPGPAFDQRITNFKADGNQGRPSTASPLAAVTVDAGDVFVKAVSHPIGANDIKVRCDSSNDDISSQSCVTFYRAVTSLAAADVPAVPTDTLPPPWTGCWERRVGTQGAKCTAWKRPGTGGVAAYRMTDFRYEMLPRLDLSQSYWGTGQPFTALGSYRSNRANVRDKFRSPHVDTGRHNLKRGSRSRESCCQGPIMGDAGEYGANYGGNILSAFTTFLGNDFHPEPSDPNFNITHRRALANAAWNSIAAMHDVVHGDNVGTPDGGLWQGPGWLTYFGCHAFGGDFNEQTLSYEPRTNAVGHDATPECQQLYDWFPHSKRRPGPYTPADPLQPVADDGWFYPVPQPASYADFSQGTAFCDQLPVANFNFTCAQIGIDPAEPVVLYGQEHQEGASEEEGRDTGSRSCIGSWAANQNKNDPVSAHCMDPYMMVDHHGNACSPDPNQSGSTYERMNIPFAWNQGVLARIFGMYHMPGFEYQWRYGVRRMVFGRHGLPDAYPQSNFTKPTNYTAPTPRCAQWHQRSLDVCLGLNFQCTACSLAGSCTNANSTYAGARVPVLQALAESIPDFLNDASRDQSPVDPPVPPLVPAWYKPTSAPPVGNGHTPEYVGAYGFDGVLIIESGFSVGTSAAVAAASQVTADIAAIRAAATAAGRPMPVIYLNSRSDKTELSKLPDGLGELSPWVKTGCGVVANANDVCGYNGAPESPTQAVLDISVQAARAWLTSQVQGLVSATGADGIVAQVKDDYFEDFASQGSSAAQWYAQRQWTNAPWAATGDYVALAKVLVAEYEAAGVEVLVGQQSGRANDYTPADAAEITTSSAPPQLPTDPVDAVVTSNAPHI